MVTEQLARSEATRLKQVMERHGVRCSIELQVGRPNRTGWGDDWFTRKVALMNHHTAGSAVGLTPSLALVKKGRGIPGTEDYLPGTLANGYGGRDLIYRVLNLGLANHPGAGGPLTVPKIGGGTYRIPLDSARHLTWGTEWEHDGVSPWPGPMQEFMGRANAALSEWLELPRPGTSLEHLTWAPKRKRDRNGYTAVSGDAEIQRWHAAGVTPPPAPAAATQDEQEDDMQVVIDDSTGAWWLVGAAPFPVYIGSSKVGVEWAALIGRPIKHVSGAAMAPVLQVAAAGDLTSIRAALQQVAAGQLSAAQVDQIVDTSLRDWGSAPATVIDHA